MNKGDCQGNLRSVGFTIIETLIVLAVTGALFVAIAATLGGRQNEAEFIHAIQDVQAQIQQVINQTSAGFYPATNTFGCTPQSNGPLITVVPNGQGSNTGCIFLGKVIAFGEGSNPEQYQILTVAALTTPATKPSSPSDFASVDPLVGDFANSFGSLEYGLSTKPGGIQVGGQSIGAIGFLTEIGLASLNGLSSTGYSSGAQQVDLVPILFTNTPQTKSQAISTINTNLRSSKFIVNPQLGVTICFVSGETNQSGIITIGPSGSQLLVHLDIRSNSTCS